MSRPSSAAASDSLPDEVRRGLVELLFADTRTMVLGAIITTISGFLVAYLTRTWAPAAVTAMMVGVVAVRLRLKREYGSRSHGDDRADLRWLEQTTVLGTSAYLLCVGLLTLTAFLVSDDAFILTLAVASAVTHALSIAVRNFAIRTGVGLQISGVAIPLAAAFLLKGGLFPLLIPMLLAPLSLFVYGSAARLREILLSEIAFRTESRGSPHSSTLRSTTCPTACA